MGLTYHQFRSKLKGSGLNRKKISQLWDKYKLNLITDQDLTQTNIQKLISTEKTKSTFQSKGKVDLIDYLSKQSPEIIRLMLLKLKIKEIDNVCHINKYFKDKVCTNYFWKLFIEKNWKYPVKAFIWAIENEHLRLIKSLITYFKNQFNPNLNENWPIRFASGKGNLELVKLLLTDSRVDPSADNNTAIVIASGKGHLELVKFLLTYTGVDPSANDNMAIEMASDSGHLEVIKLLLTYPKVDPSSDNNWPIRTASAHGHLEVVKFLLTYPKVDITADDNYAIRTASENGYLEVVKFLLTYPKVDLTADDNYAIRWASRNGHLEVVKVLKEYEQRK